MPTVIIPRSVLNAMVKEVISYPLIETAWSLYGLILPDQTVIVGGILRPSTDNVNRSVATVKLGGKRQADAMRWLLDNFNAMKAEGQIPEGITLSHLYSGHSHHQLGLIEYSFQDLMSMREALWCGLSVTIGPLAWLQFFPPSRLTWDDTNLSLSTDVSARIGLRFYYLSREMAEAGVSDPILIEPQIVDDNAITSLPPLAWPFANPDFFDRELHALEAHGCTVAYSHKKHYGTVPFQIQLLIRHKDWSGIVMVITEWDYPNSPPVFTVIPTTPKPPREELLFGFDQKLKNQPIWQTGDSLWWSVYKMQLKGLI
jgi:hypothetical protein